jgi:exopolysaccharide biosynthesis polyprenyl glycosylphosphotransferase
VTAGPDNVDICSAEEPAVLAAIEASEARVQAWRRRYRIELIAADFVIILVSTLIALYARFGGADHYVRGVPYLVVGSLLVPVWLGALAAARAYEMRFFGAGADEFRLVAVASVRLMAVIAIVAFTFQIKFARGYVAVALPLGTILLLLGRYAQRRRLHRARGRGRYVHRVLAVGGRAEIESLANALAERRQAGLHLVGVCIAGADDAPWVAGAPVLAPLTGVLDAIATSGADTVAVTGGPGMSHEAVRQLSWDLEGSGIDLVVANQLLDFAGPRVSVRPVPDLPLLQVEEPELSSPRKFLKLTVEWLFCAIAVVLVSPLLILLAVVVRIDSPGSPIFRQKRVGRGGRPFVVFKIRTMFVDAEERLAALLDQNEATDGPLFKMRDDPRVTRVGRHIRRWSLDELPQLWNVLRGDMALVGPRPPLPEEVSHYDREVGRRLLVLPGITGLWQVSGRSNLSWADSVRLDLYYLEKWSLALDVMIVWKTLRAVLRRDGAY